MKGDRFLEERLEKYERWINDGEISHASKVIPVRESIEAKQWVMPRDQVMEILKDADPIGVTDCVCRRHYRRCDNPVEVCLQLNSVAAKAIAKGKARQVTVPEAERILLNADQKGLVHLTFFMPGPEIYALCSCCDCCCHDLQLLKRYRRPDIMARSDCIVETDTNACTHCGTCIDRCVFDARKWSGDETSYDSSKCYGCGLCATVCPEDAIAMVPAEEHPM